MRIENVKHLKLTLEIAARGDYCDVSCPFMSIDSSACRLFGAPTAEGDRLVRRYYCKKFTKEAEDV
jgi:hypothetical protein